jgi:hypothetical protein
MFVLINVGPLETLISNSFVRAVGLRCASWLNFILLCRGFTTVLPQVSFFIELRKYWHCSSELWLCRKQLCSFGEDFQAEGLILTSTCHSDAEWPLFTPDILKSPYIINFLPAYVIIELICLITQLLLICFELLIDTVPKHDYYCIISVALLEERRHLHLVPQNTVLQQQGCSCHWMKLCRLSQRLKLSEGSDAYLLENDVIVGDHHDRMNARELVGFKSETINI